MMLLLKLFVCAMLFVINSVAEVTDRLRASSYYYDIDDVVDIKVINQTLFKVFVNKFLLELKDKRNVETVLIPDKSQSRYTIAFNGRWFGNTRTN